MFPFVKFEGVDTILGPEMRSTGEVMGIDSDFARAFAKSQLAAGMKLPTEGVAFLSVREADKPPSSTSRAGSSTLGFSLVATHGTAACLRAAGLPVKGINKVLEGRPHCVDAMDNHEIDFVINTTEGAQAIRDSQSLRRAALMNGIAYYTTLRGRPRRARGDRGRASAATCACDRCRDMGPCRRARGRSAAPAFC